MNAVPMAVVGTYDLNLVALSIAIAVFASYTALDLASRVMGAQGRTRLLWLAGGAGAMGIGIWSMHYIGMLALSLPLPVLYNVPIVLLSLLAAIFASAVALFVVSRPSVSFSQMLLGGSIMGLGIAAMHYTGMAAMRLPAMMHYDPLLVAASVAIAIGVSFVGLLLLFRFRERTTRWNWPKLASAIVMGLAIPGMHYTGMAAASFVPTDVFVEMSYAMDVSSLGILAITCGTALLLGLTLIIPRHRGPYVWLPALIVAITVLALAIGANALHFVETRLVAASGESLGLATAEIADKTSRFLYERYGDVELIARTFSLRADDRSYLTEHLLWVKMAYAPFYQWLAVTDQHGRIVAATDPATVGLDVSHKAWFQSVRHGRTVHVGDAQPDELAGGMITVSFTAPIISSKGEFLAAVTTRIAVAAIEDALTQTIRTFQQQQGFMGTIEYQFMTYAGDVFMDSDLAHKGNVNFKRMKLPSAMLSETNLSGFVEEEHARRHVPVITGYARSLGYQRFPGLQWTVFVRMDRSDIVVPIREDLRYLGTIGLVVGLPMVGLLLWATARVRKEHTLSQHERDVSQEYLDIAGVILLVLNADQTVRLINKKGCEILGCQEEEIIGKHWSTHFIPERERVRLNGLFDALKAGELIEHVENAILTKDGRERMISWYNTVLRDAGGAITGTLSSGEDITERKQAEDTLRQAQEQLQMALKAGNAGLWSWDAGKTDDAYLSPSWKAQLGYADEEIPNRFEEFEKRLHPEDRDRVLQVNTSFLQNPSSGYENEFRLRHKDGSYRWLLSRADLYRGTEGQPSWFTGCNIDVTERRRLEDKLRNSEQQYSLLLNSAAEGIYGIDTEGRCTFINPAAAAMLGSLPEECIGKNMHELIHHSYRDGSSYPAEKCCIFNSIRTGKGCRIEDEIFWRRNGTSFHATYTAFPIIEGGIIHGAVVTFSDSTERKEMQAQAGRMERLETLGQLVGSIAHEMRNPLFMLTGRLQLLKEKLAQQEYGAAADDLKKIESSASRLKQITERFLTIAKPLDPASEPTAVQTILKQALELLSDKLMKNKIAVTAVISPDLPTIQADPRKLQEAFTNLIVNAMQAMAEAHGKGTLTVTAAPQNGSIEVRIQDDGPGIAAEHRGRLFEPFFTTKPAGQGTGLGLWAARTTAMALRGTVACETGTGKGATFIMRLPVVETSKQP